MPYMASSRTSTGGRTVAKPFAVRRSSAKRYSASSSGRRPRRGRRNASRTPWRRAPCRCGRARGGRAARKRTWRLADAPQLDRVVVREAVGRARVGRGRHAIEQLSAPALRGGELLLDLLELRLDALELLDLLGVGLPLSLVFARSSSACGTSASHELSASMSASKSSAAPLRAKARDTRRRRFAALMSIMPESLGAPRSPARPPPPRPRGRPSRRPRAPRCAFATATPNAGHWSSSTSFRRRRRRPSARA